jgi:uncharacterized protein YkwD
VERAEIPQGVQLSPARWARAALLSALALTVLLCTAPVAGATTHHRRHHVHAKKLRHRRRAHPTSHTFPAPAPAQCANADTPATSASVDAMRAAAVCLINQQRNKRGLPSLTPSSQLNSSAQSWNNVMVATGNFSHGPGTAFADRISAAGYDWQTAGENIATGYRTPRAVVSAWMASTDHCRNILDPSFRNVGTGETPATVGSFASDPATWTQDFGLLMSQSPLSGNHGPQNGCPH